jgi:pyridoxal phosphate enzyme (YggS family)
MDEQYENSRLKTNIETVKNRIADAAGRADRDPDEITVVAVSKTHPPEAIERVYEAGLRHIGESYVQEWQDKKEELPDDIEWHFVGHLQSNKAKYIADEVTAVHSVDRRSVAKKLSKRASSSVDVFLQVNIGEEASKSGVMPDDLIDLCDMTEDYENLRIRGLMTIPPFSEDPENSRQYFKQMHQLYDEARDWFETQSDKPFAFDHLSMGMTNDFEVAVEEGATIVRVGTAIFGERRED